LIVLQALENESAVPMIHFYNARSSEAAGLCSGSTSNTFDRTFYASSPIPALVAYPPQQILPNSSQSVYPQKGKVPFTIWNSTTPQAQISAAVPSLSYFLMSSGLIYEGVPQKMCFPLV